MSRLFRFCGSAALAPALSGAPVVGSAAPPGLSIGAGNDNCVPIKSERSRRRLTLAAEGACAAALFAVTRLAAVVEESGIAIPAVQRDRPLA